MVEKAPPQKFMPLKNDLNYTNAQPSYTIPPQQHQTRAKPDHEPLSLTTHYGPGLQKLTSIDGPYLIYSAFPHDVVKQLIIAGATLQYANTGAIYKIRAKATRDFKHLLEASNAQFTKIQRVYRVESAYNQ